MSLVPAHHVAKFHRNMSWGWANQRGLKELDM